MQQLKRKPSMRVWAAAAHQLLWKACRRPHEPSEMRPSQLWILSPHATRKPPRVVLQTTLSHKQRRLDDRKLHLRHSRALLLHVWPHLKPARRLQIRQPFGLGQPE